MLNRGNDRNIIIISNGKSSQGSADRGAQFDTNLSESTLTPMASKSHSAFDYSSLEIFYFLKLSLKLMNQVTPTGQETFSYTGAVNFTCSGSISLSVGMQIVSSCSRLNLYHALGRLLIFLSAHPNKYQRISQTSSDAPVIWGSKELKESRLVIF